MKLSYLQPFILYSSPVQLIVGRSSAEKFCEWQKMITLKQQEPIEATRSLDGLLLAVQKKLGRLLLAITDIIYQ